MRILQPLGRTRLAFAAAALAAGFLLSGCGSDNDDNPPPTPPATPAPTPAPVPVIDAFFAFVLAQVGSMLDTTEPVAIDTVTETTPDNTEPEPVQ